MTIHVSSLSKVYRHNGKKTEALRHVSFSIETGDVYGIIGLSGAGKSTLIRCMAGLLHPSQGNILIDNIDIHSLPEKALRDFRLKTAMIFQHFNLFSSRTVAGNISYPLEIANVPLPERQQRIDELLDLVGLSAKKEAYPAFLSGGEKQRVGIARALANHPSILFCDEATSALDPKTTKEILDLLKTINKNLGVTIVLITHDMEVIKRICNKVAVIEHGTIIEEGLVSNVFAEPQHPTTQQFIQGSTHEIPLSFFKPPSPHRILLRLKFKGHAAGEPLISQMIKRYDIEVNILLGWIDRLQATTIGTLVVELHGTAEGIANALAFLDEKKVLHEVIQHHES
jgi:D-methionine transport system ATP-binding protein